MSLISFLLNPLANLKLRAFHPRESGVEPAPLPNHAFAPPESFASQGEWGSGRTAISPEVDMSTVRESLLRAIPDRLFLFNRRGDCLGCRVDPLSQDVSREDEFIGQNIRGIEIFRGNVHLLLEWIEQTLETHTVQAVEFRGNGPQAVYFEARLSPFNENSVLVILRDISDWKKAEDAARLAQAELALQLEQRAGELEQAEQHLSRLEQDLQREVGIREQLEEQRRLEALHDPLTGLPNRALFTERLERVVERENRRPDSPFAVLCLDLDRFQVINDSLGHAFGDRLLVQIAQRLDQLLRAGDTIARLGEDEFAILLEEIREERVPQLIAARVLKALELPFNVDGAEIFVSGSVGIVLNTPRYANPADILRDAELAMYHAKKLGKARFEVFDRSMRQHAIDRLELESRLRNALERNEFQLHYQAIQELQTGRITSFEALVRWNPAGHPPVTPADFIPVAEETGLIIPIGEWVLRQACRQMRAWQDLHPSNPPLAINVNISSRQFTHPELVEQVARILAETGIEPDSLRLEITESTFMENSELATRILADLQKIGVQFQIDDFGTGYSSLSYLHQFPVNTIKIDRTFIGRIGRDGHNAEIVRTILSLARDLRMGTIAEGIETEDQLAQLKNLDCQLGQGFFIARPMEPERVEALLEAQPSVIPD